LNYRTPTDEKTCVELPRKPDARELRFELDDFAATPSPTMRKPFDVFVKGLSVSSVGATRFELATF
jgi:hypothetical protein